MSYSRRQLYAMGEPLGESVTHRKVDGGLILGGGGGGGGGDSPVQQQTSISDLPDWAKGYAQDVLAKGKALTEGTPYQTYGAQRIADFTPLQQQAMKTAGSPEAFATQVRGYMQPYMEGVVGTQMRTAREQAGINAATLQARGAQAGAFGGSGMALQGAQAGRDLSKQLQDIQATGYQQAVQQGIQQANLANQQQMQYGSMQQAQGQRGLDLAYQDFLAQRNYPYQQLSYMSNLIRGTPMGMSQQSQVFQAPPTTAQTAASLGLGAYALSKMAEGGEVKTYAGNKGSLTSSGLGIIDKFNDLGAMGADMRGLSDEQLQEIIQHPATQAEAVAAQQELARREQGMVASEQAGMANAFNQLPPETQDRIVRAASGGILAFKAGSRGPVASDDSENDDSESSAQYGVEDMMPSRGISMNSAPGQYYSRAMERLENMGNYAPIYPTMEARNKAELASMKRMQAVGGESPYAAMRTSLGQQDTDRLEALEQNKGLAALMAIPAILEPGGLARGAGKAAGVFAGVRMQALQADRAEKRYLGQMQFNLADAERKENMGLYREARQDIRDAEANKLAAHKAGITRDQAIAKASAEMARAMRPVGGGGGGKGPKEFEYAVQTYLPEVQAMYPDIPKERQPAKAFQIYQERKGAGLPGVTARTEATAEEKARERAAKRAITDPGINEALRKKDSAAADIRRRDILQEEMNKPTGGSGGGGTTLKWNPKTNSFE